MKATFIILYGFIEGYVGLGPEYIAEAVQHISTYTEPTANTHDTSGLNLSLMLGVTKCN